MKLHLNSLVALGTEGNIHLLRVSHFPWSSLSSSVTWITTSPTLKDQRYGADKSPPTILSDTNSSFQGLTELSGLVTGPDRGMKYADFCSLLLSPHMTCFTHVSQIGPESQILRTTAKKWWSEVPMPAFKTKLHFWIVPAAGGSVGPQMNRWAPGPSSVAEDLRFNHLGFLKPEVSCPLVCPGLSLNAFLLTAFLVPIYHLGSMWHLQSELCSHVPWLVFHVTVFSSYLQAWQLGHKVQRFCRVWPENPPPRLHQTAHVRFGRFCHLGDVHRRLLCTVLHTILLLAQGRPYERLGFSDRDWTTMTSRDSEWPKRLARVSTTPCLSGEHFPNLKSPSHNSCSLHGNPPPCQADSIFKASCKYCDKNPELWWCPQSNSSVFNPSQEISKAITGTYFPRLSRYQTSPLPSRHSDDPGLGNNVPHWLQGCLNHPTYRFLFKSILIICAP